MSNQIRRVLIADEHEVVRRGVKALLETRPYLQVVAEADNGRMALAEARSTKPNIAIVDYSLRELNGVDLTHALKREIPDVEVLIFAREDSEDIVLKAFRAGVKAYVRKTDPEQDLLTAIDALSLHRPFLSGVSERVLVQALEKTGANQQTLSHREREVVQLVAEGRTNKEVAHILDISVKTVETHRAATMQKLNIRNTAQLVRYALRNKLIDA